MNVNKVILDGKTIIDLSQDTAIQEDVSPDKYFHLANGQRAWGGQQQVFTEKVVDQNGVYLASNEGVKGYDKIVVNITAPQEPGEERVVVPSSFPQTIKPLNSSSLSQVQVLPIPETYVQPYGELIIEDAGVHDVKNYATVQVKMDSKEEDYGELAILIGGEI